MKLSKYNYFINENEERKGDDVEGDGNSDGFEENSKYIIGMAYKYLTIKFPMWFEFFSRLRVAESRSIDTMATDGKQILYNPDFVKKLGVAKASFVIIHEIMHNAMSHFSRIETRNHKLWNVAGDYAINIIIKDMISDMKISTTNIDIPDDILLKEEFRGVSTVAIYEYYREKIIDEGGIDPEEEYKKSAGMFPIKVGTKVRSKSTGKVGVVTKVNSNDTYEIDYPVVESKILRTFEKYNLLNESYKRGEFSPILSGGDSDGDGDISYDDDDLEYEDDGNDGDNDGGNGKGKGNGDDNDDGDGEGNGEGNGEGSGKGKGKGKNGSAKAGDINKIIDRIAGDTGTIGDDIKEGGSLDGEGKTLYDGDEDLQKKKGKRAIQDEWKKINVDVSNKSAKYGKMSSNLRRWLDKLTKPVINWKTVLRKFAKDRLNSKYKMKKFNRRLINRGTYVSGLRQHRESGIKQAVISIDTSGSIGDKEIKIFASELKEIFRSTKIKNVDVIWCDSDIGNTQRFNRSNPFSEEKLEPAGGGGTDLRPPFEWVEDNLLPRSKPAIFIYFTDGYGTFPKIADYGISKYKDNILWVITTTDIYSTNVIPPFGQYVNLDISGV